MDNEQKEKLIQQYLQGDMSQEERSDLRNLLKSDQEYRALLEEYSLMFSDLKNLEQTQLPKDLWKRKIKPALESNIVQKETFWTRLRSLFSGFVSESMKPAMIATSFVVVIIVVTIVMQQQFFSDNSAEVAKTFERIEALNSQYTAELNVLIKEMEGREELMPAQMREGYEKTLAAIDEAIEGAERKYAIYSDDPEAINQLVEAYKKKTEFLYIYLNLEL